MKELRLEIEKYLDSGQSNTGLQSLIENEEGEVIGSLLQLDLNGDGTDEVVLSTSTSTRAEGYQWGWIGVYTCDHSKYLASYAELGSYINYARVLDGRDWLGHETAQIVVEYNWWGSACEIGVQVLAFSPKGWEWVFGDNLNCPAQVAIRENRSNGLPEIVLSGIERDVMGVEPDKEVTRIYSVQAGQFQREP